MIERYEAFDVQQGRFIEVTLWVTGEPNGRTFTFTQQDAAEFHDMLGNALENAAEEA